MLDNRNKYTRTRLKVRIGSFHSVALLLHKQECRMQCIYDVDINVLCLICLKELNACSHISFLLWVIFEKYCFTSNFFFYEIFLYLSSGCLQVLEKAMSHNVFSVTFLFYFILFFFENKEMCYGIQDFQPCILHLYIPWTGVLHSEWWGTD